MRLLLIVALLGLGCAFSPYVRKRLASLARTFCTFRRSFGGSDEIVSRSMAGTPPRYPNSISAARENLSLSPFASAKRMTPPRMKS